MKKTYLLKASVMLMVVLYYIFNTSCGTANLTNKNNYYQGSDLSKYESVRKYVKSNDPKSSGMKFNEERKLYAIGNAKMREYSTVRESHDTRMDMKSVAAHFPEFIKLVHNSDNYQITYFEFFYLDDMELIKMEYILDDDFDNPMSIMYYIAYNKNENKTFAIKCHGTCGLPTENCNLSFEISEGFKCKCEEESAPAEELNVCKSDDCNMIISEVENIE